MRGAFRAARTGLVLTAAVTGLVTGCGADGEDVVVTGTPPVTPYRGPLHVPARNLDEDSQRAVRIESGAAGRALECEGEIFSGGPGERWSEGDGGDTPEEGLEAYFDIEQPDVPRHGYRVEREEGDRVLFSLDVDGRTKVAVVVAKDRPNAPGWGPETSAACDPSELPDSYLASRPYTLWTDSTGHRLPYTEIHSYSGPSHCDWQSADFIALADATYARDPDKVLPEGTLTAPYARHTTLPTDARPLGYHQTDHTLWHTTDPTYLYVRSPDGVEAWPRVSEDFGCR
ncbi:hypothetical protein RKD23_000911 [Streptomyces sp. SAI-170]|uniref:hypothetical protein n=1 Tax=Streptomyces sp. SAI-170 TaxID=3377729 RepID=UPI003C7A2EC6